MSPYRLLLAVVAALSLAVAGCGSDDGSGREPGAAPAERKMPDAHNQRPQPGFEISSRFHPDKLDRYRYDGVIAHVGNMVVAGPGTPLELIVEQCGGEIKQMPSSLDVRIPEPDGPGTRADHARPYQYWVCAPARTRDAT